MVSLQNELPKGGSDGKRTLLNFWEFLPCFSTAKVGNLFTLVFVLTRCLFVTNLYEIIISLFVSGADGGLDFGVLKVLDETKQTCSLKNKGKFEINFNFAFEATDGSPSDVAQLFTVIPNRGPLLPTDRPTQVQVIFRSKSEITIKDQPVLKCQVSMLSQLILLNCLCSNGGFRGGPPSLLGTLSNRRFRRRRRRDDR